jgi:nitrogen fixation/metabolism regulation signal transduction histidine kinase
MGKKRKQLVVDKKFQFNLSIKAIILPLITTLTVSAVLLYFADRSNRLINENNSYINTIIDNQGSMIDMFLSTPALQYSGNPVIKEGVTNFKENIGKLKQITDNSRTITENSRNVFNILILMTIIQTIVIFSMFLFFSHKISGPIKVMRNHLKHLKEGNYPELRPLRKKDQLKEFYNEFCDTIDHLCDSNNDRPRKK